jgi:hypothetical protein
MATIVPARSTRLLRLGMILVALALLAGCGSSSTSDAAAPTATASPAVTATSTPGVQGYPIRVFFTKTPDSENSVPVKVFPVGRVSPTNQVETFAIQLLIAGPTPEERAAGYYSELNGLFNGTSQCPSLGLGGVGGPDFTLTLNMKGSTPEQGTATLKFCRVSLSGGIGVDARVLAEINATLLQFAKVKKVAVLNVQGHCYGDQSGQDGCLH